MNHNSNTLCVPEGNPGNKFAIIALIATIIAGAILAKSFKK